MNLIDGNGAHSEYSACFGLRSVVIASLRPCCGTVDGAKCGKWLNEDVLEQAEQNVRLFMPYERQDRSSRGTGQEGMLASGIKALQTLKLRPNVSNARSGTTHL